MILHLGGNTVIAQKDLLWIVDLQAVTRSRDTKRFIQRMEEEGRLIWLEGETKSYVLTGGRHQALQLYASPISSVTLGKRRALHDA